MFTFAYTTTPAPSDLAGAVIRFKKGATGMELWGAMSPLHEGVLTNAAGEKLSKQTRARAVDPSAGSAVLAAALHFLGHAVPQDIRDGRLVDLWRWAIAAWSIGGVPARRGVYPDQCLPP